MSFVCFIKSTKVISRVLFFVWIIFSSILAIVMCVTPDVQLLFCGVLAGFFLMSPFFLLPVIFLEIKRNPIIIKKREGRQKPSLFHVVFGAILSEFSSFLMAGMLMDVCFSDNNEKTELLCVFFVEGVFFVFGMLMFSGFFCNRKQEKTKSKNELITNSKYVKTSVNSIQSIGAENYMKNANQMALPAQPNQRITPIKRGVEVTDGMDGHQFEYFCARLLTRNGFKNAKVTPGSGDQGADIITEKDGVKYAFQCKCYCGHVDNKAVQEVNAGKLFYNCHVGVVITNSTFTASAKEIANATGVLLWDRSILQKLMDDAK